MGGSFVYSTAYSLQEQLIEKHLVNRPQFWKWGICTIDFIRNWFPRNHFEIDVRVIWYRDGIGKKDQHSRSKRSKKRLRSANDVLVGTKSRCSVDTLAIDIDFSYGESFPALRIWQQWLYYSTLGFLHLNQLHTQCLWNQQSKKLW
jgi:hypothetical protein